MANHGTSLAPGDMTNMAKTKSILYPMRIAQKKFILNTTFLVFFSNLCTRFIACSMFSFSVVLRINVHKYSFIYCYRLQCILERVTVLPVPSCFQFLRCIFDY